MANEEKKEKRVVREGLGLLTKRQIDAHLDALEREQAGVDARMVIAKEDNDEGGIARGERQTKEIAEQVKIYKAARSSAPSGGDEE